LTAKGRDEKPDAAQDWVRYHDELSGEGAWTGLNDEAIDWLVENL